MTQHPDHKAMQVRRAAEREERRKAELKANMARRKAQTRARAATDEDTLNAQASDKE
jgi:hypothetical protein